MPRRDFDRRARIARIFCAMGGVADDPRAQSLALKWVTAWDRREAHDEAAQLGYLELGGEA